MHESKSVEAAGIEPASQDASNRASTRVVRRLISLGPRGSHALGSSQPDQSRLGSSGQNHPKPACFEYASMDATSGASILTWLELTSVRQPMPGCPGLRKDSHLSLARCFTRPPCNLDAPPPSSTIRSKPFRPRIYECHSTPNFAQCNSSIP